jgi:hypothetical protein
VQVDGWNETTTAEALEPRVCEVRLEDRVPRAVCEEGIALSPGDFESLDHLVHVAGNRVVGGGVTTGSRERPSGSARVVEPNRCADLPEFVA